VDGLYLPSQHGLGEQYSVAIAAKSPSPWIQVDLTISHTIYGVKIWNRLELTDLGM